MQQIMLNPKTLRADDDFAVRPLLAARSVQIVKRHRRIARHQAVMPVQTPLPPTPEPRF
jgi:hypothetical protein